MEFEFRKAEYPDSRLRTDDNRVAVRRYGDRVIGAAAVQVPVVRGTNKSQRARRARVIVTVLG